MREKPRIEVQGMKLEKLFNMLAVLALLGNIIYIIISFATLPEQIPVHFNLKGEADNWGNKAVILIMPIIALLPFTIVFALSRSPETYNYPFKITEENAPRIYPIAKLMMSVLNFSAMILFALISVEMVQTAHGNPFSGIWLGLAIALPFIVLAIFIIWMIKEK